LPLTLLCTGACAPKSSPQSPAGASSAPESSTATPPPLTTCRRTAQQNGSDEYDCGEHKVTIIVGESENVDAAIDDVANALAEGFELLRQKRGAKLRIEKFTEFDYRGVRAAKVVAERPDEQGSYFAVAYAVATQRLVAICIGITSQGMERCSPVLAYFATGGAP